MQNQAIIQGPGQLSEDRMTYQQGTDDTQETLKEVASQFTSRSREARLSSIGNFVKAGAYFAAYLAVAYAVGKLVSLIVAIIAIPLAIIPPLYKLVVTLSLAIGGYMTFKRMSSTPKAIWNQMKEQWQKAADLKQQARHWNLQATRQQRFPPLFYSAPVLEPLPTSA